MFSWKTIRTSCAILLLLPVIHLAVLVWQDVTATLDTSPTAWEDEVAAYAEAWQTRDLPEDPVLVVGGRRVKLWSGLENLLRPRPVLMFGVGTATVEDITRYHAQLVGHYQPSALVVFPGNSEFHIRDNKSASELLTSIRELIELDQSYGVTQRYYVFVPIKTPLHSQDYARIDTIAQLLEHWAREEPQVTVLDANPLLSLGRGSPNPDFFRFDGSNLNENGYLRLSVMLQNHLQVEGDAH